MTPHRNGPSTNGSPYHGPHVVLTADQVARVYGWAHNAAASTELPDETTNAIRAKCEAALNARPNPTKGPS